MPPSAHCRSTLPVVPSQWGTVTTFRHTALPSTPLLIVHIQPLAYPAVTGSCKVSFLEINTRKKLPPFQQLKSL